MRGTILFVFSSLLAACGGPSPAESAKPAAAPASAPATGASGLKPPSAFEHLADPGARSVALFLEASRVITHPRCLNCHPADRVPTQGDDLHPHVPIMTGGAKDHGPPGMACNTCHSTQNVRTFGHPIASVPGNEHWGLAPLSMAWQHKSLPEICAQLKDPSRNGGRSLEAIHKHMGTDPLVGWAWNPGEGRTPAPGTQAQFHDLVGAWIATGARCPEG